MAAAADILPLAYAKTELRVVNDTLDAHIGDKISAALQIVGRHIGREILDIEYTRNVPAPLARRQVVQFPAPDFQALVSVEWGPNTDGTDVALQLTDLTAIYRPAQRAADLVFTGDGGWPSEIRGALHVTARYGVVAAVVPAAWKQAALILVRQLLDGMPLDEIPPRSTVHALLAPWMTQMSNQAVTPK